MRGDTERCPGQRWGCSRVGLSWPLWGSPAVWVLVDREGLGTEVGAKLRRRNHVCFFWVLQGEILRVCGCDCGGGTSERKGGM